MKGYFVNTPLPAADILEDNAGGLKYFPRNEQSAEKRSFEGNCQILRTIFQPRALSSDVPASQEGVIIL